MKDIEKIDLPDMKVLTPLEMNRIHFEAGLHSEVAVKEEFRGSNPRNSSH